MPVSKDFAGADNGKIPEGIPIIPSTGEDLQVDLYFELEKNHRVIKDLFDRCYDITFRTFPDREADRGGNRLHREFSPLR